MMSKLSRIQKVAIAAVMAIAVAVPIAIAQSKDAGAKQGRGGHWGERGMGENGGRGGGMMGFRNLDLTDAQKAQMKQIRESHSQSIRPIFEQIRAKRQEIRQASQSGAFNEALVTQKLTEIAPLEAKLQGEQFRIHQEMLSVLTPEQKAKLDQAREQFKSKRAERGASKQKSK
jgi:protein CpxP